MASITLLAIDPTQITLSTTVTDTVTLPAAADAIRSGRSVIVWNLSGATTLRVTVGDVGAAADPAGSTATLIATGKGASIPVPSGNAACDVKVVGSANVYSVARSEAASVGTAPTNAASGYLQLRSFATFDHVSALDAVGATTTVSCIGAALGDFTEVSHTVDVAGITVTSWVSAADVVSVRFQNESGSTLDLASGTLRVTVRK